MTTNLRPRRGAKNRINGRPATVRLSKHDYQRLSLLALVMDTTPADQVRASLESYFKKRLSDPCLPEQIEKSKTRHAQALSILEEGCLPTEHQPPRSLGNHETELVSLRLDPVQFGRLNAFALLDDDLLADQLRRAVDHYLSLRWQDSRLVSLAEQLQSEPIDSTSEKVRPDQVEMDLAHQMETTPGWEIKADALRRDYEDEEERDADLRSNGYRRLSA